MALKLSIALTPARTVFAPLLYAGDLAHGMQRAAQLGFEGIELNLRDARTEDCKAIAAQATALGLAIVSLGTGQAYLVDRLSIADPDRTVRDRLVFRIKGQIDFAASVGAQVVLGGVRGRFQSDPAVRRLQYEGAIEVVRELAEYAAAQNVTITLEPINRYESNFLNTLDETMAFIADVARPSVKILLDTFHMNIEEADVCAAITRAGPLLSHFHLADSNRWAPGRGHLDFWSTVAALRGINYNGYLSGEFLPLPNDDEAVESFVHFVRPLLASA